MSIAAARLHKEDWLFDHLQRGGPPGLDIVEVSNRKKVDNDAFQSIVRKIYPRLTPMVR